MTSASTRRQTVRYRYDALGRRVQRYIVGGRENTKFIYDGLDVIADDNNGVLTKYQNGLGIDNKLKMVTNGQAKYFLQDHLGSTIGLTDSSGAMTEQTSYDSFGNATMNLSTRYQFTGREYDSFTGLHYYRARFYDANLGRFISEDPIGFAGGDVNLYGYVKNNAVNRNDPLGLFDPGTWAAGGAATAGAAGGLTLGGIAAGGAVIVGGLAAGYAIGYYPGQWSARYFYPEQFPDTQTKPDKCETKPDSSPKPKPVPRAEPTPERPDRRFVCQFLRNDGILCHYYCTNSSGLGFPFAVHSQQYGGNCPKILIRDFGK